jgi:hypothetical protein
MGSARETPERLRGREQLPVDAAIIASNGACAFFRFVDAGDDESVVPELVAQIQEANRRVTITNMNDTELPIFSCFSLRSKAGDMSKSPTASHYVRALKDLAEKHFPVAKQIRLVKDNLNTHKPASL